MRIYATARLVGDEDINVTVVGPDLPNLAGLVCVSIEVADLTVYMTREQADRLAMDLVAAATPQVDAAPRPDETVTVSYTNTGDEGGTIAELRARGTLRVDVERATPPEAAAGLSANDSGLLHRESR